MPAQFNILAADPNVATRLAAELRLPRFITNVMVARGITTVEAAREYLSPSLDRDWLNPYVIPGMREVADAVEAAIRRNEHILVFGDFDLDGISASTVLTRGLRALGASASPLIPRRFEEGYGLSTEAMERAMREDPKPQFVVTVDCGIACREAAAQITAQGMGLAITDHHEPGDLVPQNVPVCDPKLDSECPSDVLAGVGVALKLVQALGGRFGQPYLWRELTDFATLGTVADLMPMRGENRALVADGIKKINEAPRPCIAALLAAAGAAGKDVSSTNLSFSLVPRLNAAGRMGDAQLALDLLMTDDFDEASRLAQQLEGVNDQRRQIEAELSEIAKEQAEQIYHGERALVVAGEGWHEGVKGIVASRLVNIYGVPALLFTIDGDEARGSGRSVGQISLFKAVESCSDLLTRFGGHDAAVGVTLPAANLDEFRKRLCAYMEALPPDDFHPLIEIDSPVDLGELNVESVQKLETLAPFGQENHVPCFIARHVTLSNCRAVGADKNHFSCTLTDGHASVSGIMFHCSEIEKLMKTECVVDAIFQVQVDEWHGRRSVKAMLKALEPARKCGALEACLHPDCEAFVADLYDTDDAELCADAVAAVEEERRAQDNRLINRRQWMHVAEREPEQLESFIIRALIGANQLHESQRQVMDLLKDGHSVLAIMGTGRGKSLIFQAHAAYMALREQRASLFIYPLRALIADQAYHINHTLEMFGVTAAVLTGANSAEEREQVYAGVAAGDIDIVLTTPEFFSYHAKRFAQTGRFGFVVVDEAHHMAQAKTGSREAYAHIGPALQSLGNPCVLAVTATANADVAHDIRTMLPINQTVIDTSERQNLHIDDQRNLRNRDEYLAHIIASGEKTVVYVNSREQSIAVARMLRRRVPHLAPMIGFYNAGLSRGERNRIESLFRSGSLTVLVTTSAFGEGVNIPNIRHVVLYHLPYNEIEFNQMSGRAGRDGDPASIHLLYGKGDASVNERVLHDATPDHDTMAQVYRVLRTMQREATAPFFNVGTKEMQRFTNQAGQLISVASTDCGISVFRELGLLEAHVSYTDGRKTRQLHVVENADRVNLTDSVRYREGLGEREVFRQFCTWAFSADGDTMEFRVSRPIVPEDE